MLLNLGAPPLFYPRGDIATTLWNHWWFAEALSHGVNPYRSPAIFHPFGAPLFLHTFEIVDAIIAWPVRALVGVEAAWKFAFVLHNFWTLVAAHLLARRLGIVASGAIVSAILLCCCSYRFVNAPALSLLATGHLFFLWWAIVGCWQRPDDWRRGLWLGAGAVVLLYANLYYLFFTALIAAPTGVALAIAARPGRAAWIGWSRQLGVAAMLGCGPLAFIVIGLRDSQGYMGVVSGYTEWNQIRGSADLAQLLLPRWVRALLTGEAVPDEPWALLAPPLRVIAYAPPLMFMAISLFGWCRAPAAADEVSVKPRGVRLGLVTVALLSIFVAIGPRVKVWTITDPADVPASENIGRPPDWRGISFPSPYAMLADLPGFSHIRGNTRAAYFMQAAIILLLAPAFVRGFQRTLNIAKSQGIHPAIPALAFGTLLWLEQPIPFFPTEPRLDRAGLELLHDLPGDGAVRTYPDRGFVIQGLAMYDQTIHGRPILGGYLSRDLPEYNHWIDARPWEQHFHSILAGRRPSMTDAQRTVILRVAREDGMRFIVFYKTIQMEGMSEDFLPSLLRQRLGSILWQDDTMAVVEIARE